MASVTYQFPVYTTVFHVSSFYGVREGVVAHLIITVNSYSTTLAYIVQFKKMPGLDVNCVEADLFADLPSALNAYGLLVPA